jgi:cell division septal protein FtsQ
LQPPADSLQHVRERRHARGRTGAKALLWTCGIAFLVGLAASPLLWVEEVRVIAPDPSLQAAAAQVLRVPAESSTLLPPIAELEHQAAQVPEIESVVVIRELPHRLTVQVSRRLPAALIQAGDQQLLVGMDGVLMALPSDLKRARLPLVSGLTLAEARPGARLSPADTDLVAQLARAALDSRLGGGLRLDSSQRLDLRLTYGGVQGFLGPADNLERKVSLFAQLLHELRQQGGQPAYLDVRVMERPVWRPRNEAAAGPPAIAAPVAPPAAARPDKPRVSGKPVALDKPPPPARSNKPPQPKHPLPSGGTP